jgi:hypothetical protein
VRDNPVEGFSDNIGEVQSNTDGKGFAETRRGVVMLAYAVIMMVVVLGHLAYSAATPASAALSKRISLRA